RGGSRAARRRREGALCRRCGANCRRRPNVVRERAIVWGLACRGCLSRAVTDVGRRWGNVGAVCSVLLLSVSVAGLGHLMEECRGRGARPKRVMDLRVAQGGREGGQALLHLPPSAIPVEEGPPCAARAQGMPA